MCSSERHYSTIRRYRKANWNASNSLNNSAGWKMGRRFVSRRSSTTPLVWTCQKTSPALRSSCKNENRPASFTPGGRQSRSQERQSPDWQTNTVQKTGCQVQLVSLELRRMEAVIVLNTSTPTMKVSECTTERACRTFSPKFGSSNGPRLVIQNAALNPSDVATLELDK